MSEILVSLWISSSKMYAHQQTFLFIVLPAQELQNIKGKLDFEAAKTVVQALILSRLDYCTSLLVGTPDCHLSHLQHIQNMACRVVCSLRKYDQVMASMKALYWLKIREHILQDSQPGTSMKNGKCPTISCRPSNCHP